MADRSSADAWSTVRQVRKSLAVQSRLERVQGLRSRRGEIDDARLQSCRHSRKADARRSYWRANDLAMAGFRSREVLFILPRKWRLRAPRTCTWFVAQVVAVRMFLARVLVLPLRINVRSRRQPTVARLYRGESEGAPAARPLRRDRGKGLAERDHSAAISLVRESCAHPRGTYC